MKFHVSFYRMLYRFVFLLLFASVMWGERVHLIVKSGGGEAELRARGWKLVEALGSGEWIVAVDDADAAAKVGRKLDTEQKLSEELRGGAAPGPGP